MAIKRLMREAQFPCIGKLRKGGEKTKRTITDKKTGQPKEIETYGADLTYFRFDTDDQRAATHFHAAYGEEPSEINVYLPHQASSENFSCWQEAYLAGGLQHRCDGETCVIWLDNGEYRTDPKPCPGGCKEVGRMMVIIPELQRFAYVAVETHSVHDIIRLQENLQAVEFLRGDLRGIPFVLKRTPVEISTPGENGKRTRREKWLLSIEVDPAWAALQLESMHRAALTVNGITVDDSRLLTTSYVEDDDEAPAAEQQPVTTGDNRRESAADANIPAMVAGWMETSDPAGAAKSWAVESGSCNVLAHAKNALQKVVDDEFAGVFKRSNMAQVLTAFYKDRIAKKLTPPDTQEVNFYANPDAAAEPVAAF